MNKCAEYGLDVSTSVELLKAAGIKDKLQAIYDASPSMFVSVGPTGLRHITHGEINRMKEGLTPMQRVMVELNPNTAGYFRAKNRKKVITSGNPQKTLLGQGGRMVMKPDGQKVLERPGKPPRTLDV